MSDHLRPGDAGPPQASGSSIGLADAVREQANGYVQRRKSEAAGFVSDLAKSLRSGSGGLGEGAQVKASLNTLADSLDNLAGHVDRHGLGRLYQDAAVVARRNPLITVALAAAAGYGAFHVLRANGNSTDTSTVERANDPWGHR